MKKLLFTILLLIAVIPSFVFAQAATTDAPPKLDYSGFVKCDGALSTDDKGNLKPGEQSRNVVCDFAGLVKTVTSMINWAFYISIPVAATLFAYAGVLYMTGTSGNIGKAKKIFAAVATGFIIMITAWVVVVQVVGYFIDDSYLSTAKTFVK